MVKLKLDHFINFKNQNAVTKFQLTGLCVNFLTEPLGLNILVESFKITSRTIGVTIFFVTYIVCTIQTIYTYRNNVYQTLECVCIFGIGIPVSYELTV